MDPVSDRLAAAKLWLVSPGTGPDTAGPRNLPYLATAVYALLHVPSAGVATLRADEHWRLYVNGDWVLGAEVPEIAREIAHVAWHLLMDHAGRARGMGVDRTTARAWRTAADLTVAETLDPPGCVPGDLGRRVREVRDGTPGLLLTTRRSAEEYHAMLSGLPVAPQPAAVPPEEGDEPDTCGSACDGIPRVGDLPASDDGVGRVSRVDADLIRERVAIEFRDHVATRGDRPGEALRWALAITEPKIPWEPVLARAVRRAAGWTSGRVEPTWSRPSRRASSVPGVLMPGMRRPLPKVAMVVDTSGSVDDVLLGRALGEVDGVLRGLGVPGAAVAVYACDAAVGAVTRVRRAADAGLVGGGGTDLRVGIAAATAARPRPDLVVVLTDGHTPWPTAPPPGTAVVVAVLSRTGRPFPPTPPWATRIECVLDG